MFENLMPLNFIKLGFKLSVRKTYHYKYYFKNITIKMKILEM